MRQIWTHILHINDTAHDLCCPRYCSARWAAQAEGRSHQLHIHPRSVAAAGSRPAKRHHPRLPGALLRPQRPRRDRTDRATCTTWTDVTKQGGRHHQSAARYRVLVPGGGLHEEGRRREVKAAQDQDQGSRYVGGIVLSVIIATVYLL